MFSGKFVVRTLEQAAVAFGVAFGGVALGTSGSLHKEVLGGAVAAGLRALYGVLVRGFGEDGETPSVK